MTQSFKTRHQNEETKIEIYSGQVEIRFGKELATEISLAVKDTGLDYYDVMVDVREEISKKLLAAGKTQKEVDEITAQFQKDAIGVRKKLIAERSEKMKTLTTKIDKFSKAFTSAMKVICIEAAGIADDMDEELSNTLKEMADEYGK